MVPASDLIAPWRARAINESRITLELLQTEVDVWVATASGGGKFPSTGPVEAKALRH
jgi:hypothetical protein